MKNQNACFIEPLESRIAPASFVVTTLADGTAPVPTGSLRAAIIAADAASGTSTITFSSHLTPGMINLVADLPTITKSLTITGALTTQGQPEFVINGSTFSGSTGLVDIVSTASKGISVTLNDLTIEGGHGGKAGGGVYINDVHGKVTINKSVITNNHVTGAYYGTAAGGGIYLKTGGTLTITGSTISYNSATGGPSNYAGSGAYGGGILIGGGTVTITNSRISGNTATGSNGVNGAAGFSGHPGGYNGYGGGSASGGGIYNAGKLTINSNSIISGNYAQGGAGGSGGAPYYGYASPGGAGNGGSAFGGGIASKGALSIVGSTVSGNQAIGGLGGNGADAALYGHSGAPGGYGGNASGGGIWSSGTLSLSTAKGMLVSKVTGNFATAGNGGSGGNGGGGNYQQTGYTGGAGGTGGSAYGGGIASYGMTTLVHTTVSLNVASGGAGGHGGAGGRGGGNYSSYSAPTGGNGGAGGTAGASDGGGLYAGATMSIPIAKTSITSSTISGNTAVHGAQGSGGPYGTAGTYYFNGYIGYGQNGNNGSMGAYVGSFGGGVFASHTAFNLVQATITGNTADQGGGLGFKRGIYTHLDNSTIVYNHANYDGGGVYAFAAPVSLISSVVAGNTGTYSPDIDATVFAMNSLIQNVDNASVFDAGGCLFNLSPDLGSLGIHGAGLTEVFAPLAGSPLIGMGSNPLHLATDADGGARSLHGKVDIGAVEVG